MKQKEFKEKMPRVSEWVDSLVDVFGKDAIHGSIRKGLEGEPWFYASENGHTIGTRLDRGAAVGWDAQGIARARTK